MNSQLLHKSSSRKQILRNLSTDNHVPKPEIHSSFPGVWQLSSGNNFAKMLMIFYSSVYSDIIKTTFKLCAM